MKQTHRFYYLILINYQRDEEKRKTHINKRVKSAETISIKVKEKVAMLLPFDDFESVVHSRSSLLQQGHTSPRVTWSQTTVCNVS